MNTPNRQPARQPKGTSTGGQFAASYRDEADVSLADDAPWVAFETARRKASLDGDEHRRRGRLDVLTEVRIMLDRPDLEPNYAMHTPFRGRAMREYRRTPSMVSQAATVEPEHAVRCVTYCRDLADRFEREATNEERILADSVHEPEERNYLAEDAAYHRGLAEEYRHWEAWFAERAES